MEISRRVAPRQRQTSNIKPNEREVGNRRVSGKQAEQLP